MWCTHPQEDDIFDCSFRHCTWQTQKINWWTEVVLCNIPRELAIPTKAYGEYKCLPLLTVLPKAFQVQHGVSHEFQSLIYGYYA